MKTFMKKTLRLQMTALFLTVLTAAFAASAKPDKELPFRGTIQGVEIATVEFPLLFVDATGSGEASHLGRFTLTYELEVDLLTLPFETSGSAVFTAANGDSLFTDIVGLGTPDGDFVSVVEAHTITGGTGRFEGASGSFIRTYLLNLVTGSTSGSFDGTIIIDKGK